MTHMPASLPSETLTAPASPTTSQSSSAEGNGPSPKSKKDRRCQFCHQKFTSSSLGRHLDLFIRPKNPKAPDGVHDVIQIRKIRGGITRRTTKHNAGHGVVDAWNEKRDHSSFLRSPRSPRLATGSSQSTPVAAIPPPIQVPSTSTVLGTQLFRHQPNFSATGVINDLPPRSIWSSASTPGSQPQNAPSSVDKSSQAASTQENLDHARALEMAFKEVLRTIHAATDRVHKSSLFPFDPLALSFPALCLRILQPPTTLFSAAPTSTSASWPLGLPDESTYDAVHKELSQRVCDWRRGFKFRNISASFYADGKNGLTGLGYPIDPESQPVFSHLTDTWEYWQTLSLERKQEIWQLEMMRALAEAQNARDEVEKARSEAQLEADQLRVQLDTMRASQQLHASQSGHHQYPSGATWRDGSVSASPHATATIHSPAAGIPKNPASSNPRLLDDVAVELSRTSAGPSEWDFDCLLSKWKDIIQGSRGQGQAPSLFAGRAPPFPSVTSFSQRQGRASSPGTGYVDGTSGFTMLSPTVQDPNTPATPNNATAASRAPPGQLQSQAQGQGRFRTSIWINSRSVQQKSFAPNLGSDSTVRLSDELAHDLEGDSAANIAKSHSNPSPNAHVDDSHLDADSSQLHTHTLARLARHVPSGRGDGPRHMFPPYALIGEDERSAGVKASDEIARASAKASTVKDAVMDNAPSEDSRLANGGESQDREGDREAASDVSMDY